ncbi:MAG: lasso RiPP family leader peptide-containing protein [Chloroflexi bacterium]|nr:lasso RiPP family leader peptide-containing protein [Chloroflexota bacterium]
MNICIERPAELMRRRRRSYRSPRLTEYGSVRQLTAGAGGGPGDTMTTSFALFQPPENPMHQDGKSG